MFKTLMKIIFALGLVFAAVAAIFYLTESKGDYIQIYNDFDDDDLDILTGLE